MRKKYFLYYPRNFANEYTTIYTESKEQTSELMEWYKKNASQNSNLESVTTKQLRTFSAIERFRRKTDPAFSGFCCPWNPVSVEDFLHPKE